MRLYFSDIAPLINRSDFRAVDAWCLKNGVKVKTDGKKYVDKFKFLNAYFLPIINDLQEEYPDNWQEVFAQYLNDNHIGIFELTSMNNIRKIKIDDYDPQSEDAKKLFRDFGLQAS